MNELLQIFMPALIALFCTCWIYPYILKVAKIKNIVDNPDARKLQRIPIPVLGGFTVVFGILTGIECESIRQFQRHIPHILGNHLHSDRWAYRRHNIIISKSKVCHRNHTGPVSDIHHEMSIKRLSRIMGAGYDSQLHFHSPDHLRLRGYYQRHQSHRWCRWVFFGIQHRQLYPVRCNVLYAGQYQNGDTGRNCRFFALSILPA